jgi:tuberculosinol/isotuberculosinol synthase
MIDEATFRDLPTNEVARLVRECGSHVCVFPINGTRRWYVLEHGGQSASQPAKDYLQVSSERLVAIYRLLFDHGLDTLLIPVFGPDLIERGDGYMQEVVADGLRWFSGDERLWAFCETYQVRVRVYGDARRYLAGTAYLDALERFENVAERRTSRHQRRKLFFGMCAHDATARVAAFAVHFHQIQGRLPDKHEIVEHYYGDAVGPVDLFIGFDRPAAFDMPLVATGAEDLYFTVSPSLYMDARTLRAILYDHLYARQLSELDYADLSAGERESFTLFYRANRHHALGIGRKHPSGHFWYPLPQVDLPPALAGSQKQDRRP